MQHFIAIAAMEIDAFMASNDHSGAAIDARSRSYVMLLWCQVPA